MSELFVLRQHKSFLIDAQHQGLGERIQVQTNNVVLMKKLEIGAELEILHPMRLSVSIFGMQLEYPAVAEKQVYSKARTDETPRLRLAS